MILTCGSPIQSLASDDVIYILKRVIHLIYEVNDGYSENSYIYYLHISLFIFIFCLFAMLPYCSCVPNPILLNSLVLA